MLRLDAIEWGSSHQILNLVLGLMGMARKLVTSDVLPVA